jgi:hypothetical protein
VAADAPQLVRVALGGRRDAPAHWVVPSEATIRRTLARLDAETLAEVIGAWLADLDLAGAVVTADALHAHAVGDGGPWSSMPSPAWPTPGPALPGWRTCYVGTGRLRTGCTGCGT